MVFVSDLHHRRSLRLRGYDYAAAGAYFMTICTQGRACLFSEVVEGTMVLNPAGEMVEWWWRELPNKFPTVAIDSYVVMPDHFHGLLLFVGAPLRGSPDFPGSEQIGRPHRAAPTPEETDGPTLGGVMVWFKTMTTNAYIRGVNQQGWPPFPGRLWQRNYHERIVRNDAELTAIREYMDGNPTTWTDDQIP